MPPPPPRHRRTTGFWVAIGLLSLFLFLSVVVNLAFFVGSMMGAPTPLRHEAEDEFPRLTERGSYGSGDVKVVRIPIRGVLFRETEGRLFATARFDKIENILRQIRAARNDQSVRALILEVDSPGGAITPSDEIYDALQDFKQSQAGRIVVVHMQDLAASGAYYIAMAGDWLVAEPTAVVGSIGVIMQSLNWQELSEKVGIKATTIKSGANKDLLNPFEAVKPEQVALLQEMIDAMYQRFVDIVERGRDLDPELIGKLADGRIFSADAALENNLIDEIGYWDDVVARTAELLGVEKVLVVRYEQAPRFFDWLAEMRLPFSPGAWRDATTPRFLYLWRP